MIRTRNLASSSIDAGQEPVGASEEARMTVRNVGPSMTLANMRENGPESGHRQMRSLRAPSRRQRRRPARERARPRRWALSPLQPLQRQARLNQARMAYRPAPRRP